MIISRTLAYLITDSQFWISPFPWTDSLNLIHTHCDSQNFCWFALQLPLPLNDAAGDKRGTVRRANNKTTMGRLCSKEEIQTPSLSKMPQKGVVGYVR